MRDCPSLEAMSQEESGKCCLGIRLPPQVSFCAWGHSQVLRGAAKHHVKFMAHECCVFLKQWEVWKCGKKILRGIFMRHEYKKPRSLSCWCPWPTFVKSWNNLVILLRKIPWYIFMSCTVLEPSALPRLYRNIICSAGTTMQKSWKLKLRILLVQIRRNTKEKSCSWSTDFLLFYNLCEIQFNASEALGFWNIFFQSCSNQLFLCCMKCVSFLSQAQRGSALYYE